MEASIDPLFRVLTEGQAERLFNEAFASWFQAVLAKPPEGVRRSLRRASRGSRPGDVDEDGPTERLRRAGFALTEWRDFREPWTREPFDRAGAITRLIELVHELADLSREPSYAGDNLFVDTEPVRRLSRDLRRMATPASDDDLDELESLLVELRRNRDVKRARKGSGPTYAKGVTRAQVLDARDRLMQALDEFQFRADADLSALLHEELMACVDMYEAVEGARRRAGLPRPAGSRARSRRSTTPRSAVTSRVASGGSSSTSSRIPIRCRRNSCCCWPPTIRPRRAGSDVTPVAGKLFIVGDPKQSIYRFRRADVDVYRRVCELLVERGATRVELRRSFRSVPNIQHLVNAAFEPVMDGDRRHPSGTIRGARAVARRVIQGSRRSSSCPSRHRTASGSSPPAKSSAVFRTRSARTSTGW